MSQLGYETDDSDDSDEENMDIVDAKIRNLLESAIRSQHISEKKVEYWVQKFEQLHMTYKDIEQRESALLIRNQNLYRELKNIEHKYNKTDTEKNQLNKNIRELKTDKKKSLEALKISEAQISENEVIIINEENEVRSLEKSVEENKKDVERRAQPIIEELKHQITESKKELNGKSVTFDRYKKQRDKLEGQVKDREFQIIRLRSALKDKRYDYEQIKHKPIREQKQKELVFEANDNAKEELKAKQAIMMELREESRDSEETIRQVKMEIDLGNEQFEEEKRLERVLEKDISLLHEDVKVAKRRFNQLEKKHEQYSVTLGEKKRHLKEINDSLKSKKREVETRIRKIRQDEKDLTLAQKNLQSLESKDREVMKYITSYTQLRKSTIKKLKELEETVDLEVNRHFNKENQLENLQSETDQRTNEIEFFEEDIKKLHFEERDLNSMLKHYGILREEMSRKAAIAKKKFIETIGEVKIARFYNVELKKNINTLTDELKEMQTRYCSRKIQRNRFSRVIQEHRQILKQFNDSMKILNNEKDVLQKKAKEKDQKRQGVYKLKRDIDEIQTKKKTKLSSLNHTLKQLESKIEESDSQINKLTTILDEKEREMMRLKTIYEGNVEERNATGIHLVDRNDELCILHEKCKVQERIIKESELRLAQQQQLEGQMQRRIDNVQRELRVQLQKVPQVEKLIREKEKLENELDLLEGEVDILSEKIENPKSNDNWRILNESNVPKEEYLKEKIVDMEEKVQNRNEKLMEKQLILQHVTKASDGMREFALKERNDTLEFAVGMNEVTSRIREEDKRIKALFSELSIVQSQIIEVDARVKNMEKGIEEVGGKMETNRRIRRWDEEWERDEEIKFRRRKQLILSKIKRREEFVKKLHGERKATTAIIRPTSYLPNDVEGDIGLPKPYLMKPVMPSAPSNMMVKHVKKPKSKIILI